MIQIHLVGKSGNTRIGCLSFLFCGWLNNNTGRFFNHFDYRCRIFIPQAFANRQLLELTVASTMAGVRSDVITISDCSATSRGESAAFAPWSTSV